MITLSKQLIYQDGYFNKPIARPKRLHQGGCSNNAFALQKWLFHSNGHFTEQTLSPMGQRYKVVVLPKYLFCLNSHSIK